MIFSINMVSAIEVEESDNSTTYQLSSIDSSQEIAAGDTDSSLESPTSGTVYVSKTGSDSNDGSTKDKALASLTHALNVVPNSGNIIMLDGAYSYSSISIPSSKIVTIEGEGNVNLTGLSAYSTFITNEGDLFSIMSDLACTKRKYDKIAYALEEVKTKGYGIVTPSIDELVLEEPEMVKQGTRFGVKLRATAPSIHMIKTNVTTEVSPIVGSEKQSEELVNYLLSGFENDPTSIWSSNIFGKSLNELVNEGLQTKLAKMPVEAQMKLQETLERIVNEGSGGLICIIL